MKAKTINFERGANPKAAMKIGGIQFGVEYDKIKKRQHRIN